MKGVSRRAPRAMRAVVIAYCFTLAAAGGLTSASAALLGTAASGHLLPVQVAQAQAPGADTSRVAAAGRRLEVRSAPKGNSPIVGHVERGDQVLVVGERAGWAKIEDIQSGHPLGWVRNSLLVDAGD